MFSTFYGDGYSYGFNGMELEDEHSQGKYDFGARIYDSRIGRWLTIDILSDEYSDVSNYSYAGNSVIKFIDIGGYKFVNGQELEYMDAACKKETAENNYKKWQEEHPKAWGLKKMIYKWKSGYNSTMKAFEEAEHRYDMAVDFINQLAKASPEEYEYFENLEDKNENEIEIVINVVPGKSPSVGLEGNTGNFERIDYSDGSVVPTAQKKSDDENSPRQIVINLYESNGGLTPSEVNELADGEVYKPWGTGWDYETFTNELGDAKYWMEEVCDQESYDLWNSSASSSDPLYRSNSEGAGHYSREYSEERVNDLNEYNSKSKP